MKKQPAPENEKLTRLKNVIIAISLITLYTVIIFMCCYVYIKVFNK